jgi:hypothetical protein
MDNARTSSGLFADKSLERQNVDRFAYGALRHAELLRPLSLHDPDPYSQGAVHDFVS